MSEHAPPPERVHIRNPADGGFLYWLVKLYGFAFAAMACLLGTLAFVVYLVFAASAPPAPDLAHYDKTAPTVSRVWAADGTLLGEFADEWREMVPFDRIPPRLWQAFLAAEDHEFFDHRGIYVKGIMRAAWRNLTAGDWVQGGSTITQQVAKQFVGAQKTLARKVNEAIIARRLESRFSKNAILTVYLNHIYLGSGAFGVQAAARRYFSADVDELDLAQLALLGGLAKAPSRDSPITNPERARDRRNEVIERMARHGYITKAEADEATASPLRVRPMTSPWGERHPYFAEHVRRELTERFGRDALMRAGLQVETTVVPWVDGYAADTVDYMARKQDKRQGWRGPEARLLDPAARATFLERTLSEYGVEPPAPGRRFLTVVDTVEAGRAKLLSAGHTFVLPLKYATWAYKYSRTDTVNDYRIASLKEALHPGDVVWVKRPEPEIKEFHEFEYDEKLNPRWVPAGKRRVAKDEVSLEQTPRVQSAIITLDHESGYVLAMIGGQDHARSEFNRVTQACRQPGSTYKPIYYSLAIDQGYSIDSRWNDKPKAEVDPETGEIWVPVNHQGTIDLEVSLEYALVFSKNIPSVAIFSALGGAAVEAWARRLGFTSEIIADKALALGASCTYMDELSRAFSIFARNGRWLDLVAVKRVRDRAGRLLLDQSVYWDDALSPRERLDRLAVTAGHRPKQAIPERSAYLITKLLSEVVSNGHSSALRRTAVPTAGKTGTSSATMDLWFVAFTSRWLTTTWIGDDLRERDLGKHDAAYMSAVPMWARYMREVTRGQTLSQELPWSRPASIAKNERGGNKGTLGAPMPLVPPTKVQSTDGVPEGLQLRERHDKQRGSDATTTTTSGDVDKS